MSPLPPAPDGPSIVSKPKMVAYATLSACLSASYGVLFTIVGDFRDTYGISEAVIGWIIGVGFIVAFLTQVFIAPFGDRGFARALVFGGAALNVAGVLLMAFGTTATVLLAGRVVGGIGIGMAVPAIRRIIVLGSGDEVGRNLGWLFSADVFGFAMGPVISAFLVGPFGLSAPFLVIAVTTAIVAGSIAAAGISVPETDPAASDAPTSGLAWDLFRLRPFAGAVLVGTAAFVMIGGFDTLWDQVHTDLGTPGWMSDLGIALFAIPLVLLGPFAGTLAQRVGPFIVAAAGTLLAALWMGVYGVLGSGVAIFWVTMVHALTDGFTFAATGVAVGMAVPEDRQAAGQGMLGGMQALGAGITAPMIGWIYGSAGQQSAYWTSAAVTAVLTLLGLLVAGRAVRELRDPDVYEPATPQSTSQVSDAVVD